MGAVAVIIITLMSIIYYLFNANRSLKREAALRDSNDELSRILSEKERQDAIAKKAQEDYERARTELGARPIDSRHGDGDVR